ncbi:PEP-CTERM sorting domain-containing protein [Anthocerotibacter panamensis]|uniref:PEP-CTERM sorting domain-containing protein n=1 Tax=Anthocerotibacter panamensis TaxID=2857077 RepID=UPI001C406264|nr:PEP-CTERM sorting domain-containing protein [Anthocerotibacter panamensis]
MASKWLTAVVATTLVTMMGGVQAAAFTEIGDAGESISTATITSAASTSVPLTNIFGSLASASDADLFLINVTDISAFSATTVNSDTSVDTQLFLFSSTGQAIYFNDDDPGGLSLQSTLPAGSLLGPTSTGLYYLGIAPLGYDPIDFASQLLFVLGAPTDVLGPATSNTLSSFFPSFLGSGGTYTINLTGATAAVPEPASVMGFLALGAAFGCKKRTKS